MFKFNKNKTMRGFTLIELVIVMVILAVLAITVLPNYVNLRNDALSASMSGAAGAVAGAWAVYIADNRTAGTPQPTVNQLTNSVQVGGGAAPTATTSGVQFTIDGTTVTVQTYTDTGCSSATAGTGFVVQCVGQATTA